MKKGKNPLNFFGPVRKMSFRDRKKCAIKAVWCKADLELPEQNLIMAIVSTAINDIREKEETALSIERRNDRHRYINTPPEDIVVKNSIQSWYDGDIIPYLIALNIEWDYVREVFKHFKLLPKELLPMLMMVRNDS